MIAFQDDTKPSRINRKRRWKLSGIADLIKSGLTDCYKLGHDLRAGNKPVGRENLFIFGVNTPRTFAVFLCLPFCAALCRLSLWWVAFGQSSGWLATKDQYSHPTTTRRPSREKLDRWLIPIFGVTA